MSRRRGCYFYQLDWLKSKTSSWAHAVCLSVCDTIINEKYRMWQISGKVSNCWLVGKLETKSKYSHSLPLMFAEEYCLMGHVSPCKHSSYIICAIIIFVCVIPYNVCTICQQCCWTPQPFLPRRDNILNMNLCLFILRISIHDIFIFKPVLYVA